MIDRRLKPGDLVTTAIRSDLSALLMILTDEQQLILQDSSGIFSEGEVTAFPSTWIQKFCEVVA